MYIFTEIFEVRIKYYVTSRIILRVIGRDPANPTWDPRLIPGGIPPEIGGIPPGIPPGIMERPGRHPTWDPN